MHSLRGKVAEGAESICRQSCARRFVLIKSRYDYPLMRFWVLSVGDVLTHGRRELHAKHSRLGEGLRRHQQGNTH